MAEHILQYDKDTPGPNWCVNCGTFAEWCTGACEGGSGEFDNRVPANVERVIGAVFGLEARNGD